MIIQKLSTSSLLVLIQNRGGRPLTKPQGSVLKSLAVDIVFLPSNVVPAAPPSLVNLDCF